MGDTELPDSSWQPLLPFVWFSTDSNLLEGARFQYALARPIGCRPDARFTDRPEAVSPLCRFAASHQRLFVFDKRGTIIRWQVRGTRLLVAGALLRWKCGTNSISSDQHSSSLILGMAACFSSSPCRVISTIASRLKVTRRLSNGHGSAMMTVKKPAVGDGLCAM